MRESHLQHLACPRCHGALVVESITSGGEHTLEAAQLRCGQCGGGYPIVNGVPRFVSSDNYAANFGLEWNVHDTTQYDSHTGLRLSETRFYAETCWPRTLAGEMILEAGCGSGRFTEQAAATGAFVVSMDYSGAVDAAYQSHGTNERVLVVQGDIYQMPFRPGSFDKALCIGVLQHTPDPTQAFLSLPPMLKPGGQLVIDVYKRKPFILEYTHARPYLRTLTCHVGPTTLYKFTRRWVDVMWPLSRVITKVPRIGQTLNWRLMIADYSDLGLTGRTLKEWAYLDTFDSLSPRYEHRQTVAEVRRWFAQAAMIGVEIDDHSYDKALIVARGKMPAAA